jgi:dipeptidase E
MILFLTSSPSGCPFDPGPETPVLDPRNRFTEQLHAVWPDRPPRCLMLAADPDNFGGNDQMRAAFDACFRNEGLPFAETLLCDRRNQGEIAPLLARCEVLILCGGHVPTQNRFFAELELAARLQGFDGILIGISAGTMNAARLVYAQPEEPGEAADPQYQRWIPGLGLTESRVWPHFQRSRHLCVDGQNLEQLGLADSRLHPFYALPDGSYILHTERPCADPDGHVRMEIHETVYGEAYRFADGQMTQICENDQSVALF